MEVLGCEQPPSPVQATTESQNSSKGSSQNGKQNGKGKGKGGRGGKAKGTDAGASTVSSGVKLEDVSLCPCPSLLLILFSVYASKASV